MISYQWLSARYCPLHFPCTYFGDNISGFPPRWAHFCKIYPNWIVHPRQIPSLMSRHQLDPMHRLIGSHRTVISTLHLLLFPRPILTEVPSLTPLRKDSREFRPCRTRFDQTYAQTSMYETTHVSPDIHVDVIRLRTFPMMIAITVDTCDLGYTNYSSSRRGWIEFKMLALTKRTNETKSTVVTTTMGT